MGKCLVALPMPNLKMHGCIPPNEVLKDSDEEIKEQSEDIPKSLPCLTAEHSLRIPRELVEEGGDAIGLEEIFSDLDSSVLEKLELPIIGMRLGTARRTVAGKRARVECHRLKNESSGYLHAVSKISETRRRSVARDLSNHHLLQFAPDFGLTSTPHPIGRKYIIPFLGVRKYKGQIYHYMPKGESAFDYVQNKWFESAKGFQANHRDNLPSAEWDWEKKVAQWSAELIHALQYIHDLGFSHNDVKLENVVLLDGRACLIDFDSMTPLGTEAANEMMTKTYCSRETKSGGKYCPKLNDTYALGICIFMMLFAHQPDRSEFNDLTSGSYQSNGRKRSLEKYVYGLGRKRLVSEPAFDFLKCVLRPEHNRSTLSELATHPWIVENSTIPAYELVSTPESKFSTNVELEEDLCAGIGLESKLPSLLRRGVDLALEGVNSIARKNLLSDLSQHPSTTLMPYLEHFHPELARNVRIAYYYEELAKSYSSFCDVPRQHVILVE